MFVRRAVSRAPLALARSIALGLIIGLVGCGGGGEATAPAPVVVDNTPATVVLSPATPIILASGVTASITATVAAKDGHLVSGASVVWTSADASVASVSGGIVTALKTGTTSITATSGSAMASVAVTVTVGIPTQLAVRTQPVGGTVGSALATQPVVEIRDAGGNLVTSSTASITATIAATDGTLGGTTTVSAVGGVATFSGLTITGVAGTKTLGFSSPALVSVTSAPFTLTAPPTPVIVLSASSATFAAVTGASPAAQTVTVTNGGTVAFTVVTVDPAVYDAGQATGWLTATVTGSAAPYSIVLTPSTAALGVGTYHAIVRVNAPGAPNTPAAISVTLTVTPSSSVSYGTAADRIRLLDIGSSFTPTVVATTLGAPKPVSAVTFTSRAPSVASVDAAGKVTAVAPGQSWIVGTLEAAGDSVFVNVPNASGPVLRADLTQYSSRVGDTVIVTISLDPRASSAAAATMTVGYTTVVTLGAIAVAPFSAVSLGTAVGPPAVTAAIVQSGLFRLAVASATPFAGVVPIAQIRLITPRAGVAGWITLNFLDVVAADGTDLTAQSTSTRYPIIVP
jgi:hypothetical protein